MEESIKNLFSGRVAKALADAGIDTLGEVMNYIANGNAFVSIEGIGPAGADEIDRVLLAQDDESEGVEPVNPNTPEGIAEEQPVEEAVVEKPTPADTEIVEEATDEIAEEQPPEETLNTEPQPVNLYGVRCVNCGNRGNVVERGDSRHCEKCGHAWGEEEEQSPFRKTQR